jgi:hypothetical protein
MTTTTRDDCNKILELVGDALGSLRNGPPGGVEEALRAIPTVVRRIKAREGELPAGGAKIFASDVLLSREKLETWKKIVEQESRNDDNGVLMDLAGDIGGALNGD